jgi:II/X family phage/plasmid replication protein
MTTTTKLDDSVIESLFPAQRTAYFAWVGGHDLRQVMPARSFYRLRAKLLPHGIDIATLQPKEIDNVVRLGRVLEAKPVRIPDWAIGTPLYFEPTPIRRVA